MFYKGQIIPDNFKIVGLLFSPSEIDVEFDPLIKEVLHGNENELKIFCTMGSSGTKKQLLEAIWKFIADHIKIMANIMKKINSFV